MAELIKVRSISDQESIHQTNSPKPKQVITTSEGKNGIHTQTKSEDQPDPPSQKQFQIWKNLLFISFGFLFLFTAFSSLQNIQSSLNQIDGLGTASLSTIYASMMLSCMFVPSFIINKIGCKWTIVMSMLMYTTYMAANFDAQWYTLIPSAFILGLGAAPLWSAKCTYLTQIGTEYASYVGSKAEVIIVRFFGIFFMIFQSGQISGNLISSFVLDPDNQTIAEISEEQRTICGASYCNEPLSKTKVITGNSTVERMKSPDEKVYMLCGIYVGCALFGALLVSICVDSLQRTRGAATGSANKTTGLTLLAATFKHMANKKQILIIPLTIYSGLEQAFIAGDYTIAFVTCPLGIHRIGFVMVCFGVVNAICCVAFEPVVKKFSRVPIFILGALINSALAITMLNWHPDPDNILVFYILSGFWGMADAIWQTQINAFYGVVFSRKEEAAFSNYRLWESLGFIMAFAYANHLCIKWKLYILMSVLTVGMVGYLIIEYILSKNKKKENQPI